MPAHNGEANEHQGGLKALVTAGTTHLKQMLFKVLKADGSVSAIY